MTDIATRPSEDELALSTRADFELDASDIRIPILKLTQGQTREVTSGSARPGEFVNSLTGEDFGNSIEFLVAGFHKGRFMRGAKGTPQAGRAYVATGAVVPENWEHPCSGEMFVDCPNAEEQYRASVQRKEREWGSGPEISTTYNFIGYVVGSKSEEFPNGSLMPVKLSLMRAQAKIAKNMVTMLNFRKAPWDVVFDLSTSIADGRDDTKYAALSAANGRRVTDDERELAITLAMALRDRAVQFTGDEDALAEQAGPAPASAPEGSLGATL